MKEIKVLKHVGIWEPGDVIEVEDHIAEHMCKETELWDGAKMVIHQKAMLLSDAEELENIPADVNQLTAKQMADLNLKNVVSSVDEEEFNKIIEQGPAASQKKGKKSKSQEAKLES